MFFDSVLTVPKGKIYFRENFFKIGNRRRNIKLLVTLPQIAICLTARKANGRGILTPWGKTRGEDTVRISGWECAAGTLELLTYTRASSAEFCYPILE